MFFKRAPKERALTVEPADERTEGSEAVLRDELGLYHLWYLEVRLRQELARAARTEGMFSMAAWRMRLLPGETTDPQVLCRCAELIVKSLRPYDIVARIDNERFVAILFDANFDNAATVAFRIKGDLQLRLLAAGRWQAGVATFQRDGVDADSLIQATLRRLEEDARAA